MEGTKSPVGSYNRIDGAGAACYTPPHCMVSSAVEDFFSRSGRIYDWCFDTPLGKG